VPNYFLDTSAFAKLYHQEAGSEYVEHLVEQKGSSAVISRLSLAEIESVIAIKVWTRGYGLENWTLLAKTYFDDGSARISPKDVSE
jgi:uncharacterized protein with PIN domain